MPSQLCLQAKPFFPDANQVQTKKEVVQAPKQTSREDLISNVAGLLEEIIAERGASYTDASEIPEPTLFHAKKLPQISIKNYLKRFGEYTECHEDAFVYAMIYLDRCAENIEDFGLDSFNVLRLILVSLLTAIKFYDDAYYKNSFYARIGGVKVDELNKLEQEYLCNYTEFNLYVDTETYTSYYEDIMKFNQAKEEKIEGNQNL